MRRKVRYMKKENIVIAILFIVVMSLSACEKFLELTPKHAIPDDESIVDGNSAEQAVRGLYRAVGSYTQSYVQVNILAGGDATYNNVGDPHLIIAHDYRADNANFESPWAGIYRAINLANLVIQKLPTISDPGFSDAQKNQLIGEALFFRALAYFDLVRVWGGVPLKLTYTENLNEPLNLPRSSIAETYAQIEADLNQASSLLSSNGTNRIRVSQPALQALRSRVYLYQERWTDAEQSASALIGNANYKLVYPFSAWFKEDVGTEESILEIAYSAQSPNGFRSNLQHQTRGGAYSLAPKAAVATLLDNPAIGGGPNGRRALVGSLTQAGTTIWYGDIYFRSPATDPLYLLRIAEQYLIRAEARVRNGNLESGLADINAVRQRANLEAYTANNYEIGNAAALLSAIEQERRFEFLWEGDRWPDLVRTRRAIELFHIPEYKLLFPIPLDEVVIGGLAQNPQYE